MGDERRDRDQTMDLSSRHEERLRRIASRDFWVVNALWRGASAMRKDGREHEACLEERGRRSGRLSQSLPTSASRAPRGARIQVIGRCFTVASGRQGRHNLTCGPWWEGAMGTSGGEIR